MTADVGPAVKIQGQFLDAASPEAIARGHAAPKLDHKESYAKSRPSIVEFRERRAAAARRRWNADWPTKHE